MTNIIEVNYDQTGESIDVDSLGMREMQRRVYDVRNKQYILVKAPPASGKSRALMFVGLDKVKNKNVEKVIVGVPERSIGSSFKSTNLSKFGFYNDWKVEDKFDLCIPGGEKSKSEVLKKFLLDSNSKILICTHSTLRNVVLNLKINMNLFDKCLVAIDEFHHVSSGDENKLGEVVNILMKNSSSHIIAMTGSYFRGDNQPVLLPEDEKKFKTVSFNYYEQLNGYKYLKSLGIGYHFYQGRYLDALKEVLDPSKKTLIHIPHPMASESIDKNKEVDSILEYLGEIINQDKNTGVINVKNENGRILKVADLVDDTDTKKRDKILDYLRNINKEDEIDIIIALGMAKEGFDWTFCEHALTVGYRSSLTEVIQIIGRATRDSPNKGHAQFTNLISQPDAKESEVTVAVNNLLKAITASLLMEQVLAPNIKFKAKKVSNENDKTFIDDNTIEIEGFPDNISDNVKEIIQNDLDDVKATILQDQDLIKTIASNVDPEYVNKYLVPKILSQKYPDLNEVERNSLRDYVLADNLMKKADIKEVEDKRFIRMANRFINVEDLKIDLIYKINPFQKAYEILSKDINVKVLRLVNETLQMQKIKMTKEEAVFLYNKKIGDFIQKNKKEPSINSDNPKEKRMAEAIIFLKNLKRGIINEE